MRESLDQIKLISEINHLYRTKSLLKYSVFKCENKFEIKRQGIPYFLIDNRPIFHLNMRQLRYNRAYRGRGFEMDLLRKQRYVCPDRPDFELYLLCGLYSVISNGRRQSKIKSLPMR